MIAKADKTVVADDDIEVASAEIAQKPSGKTEVKQVQSNQSQSVMGSMKDHNKDNSNLMNRLEEQSGVKIDKLTIETVNSGQVKTRPKTGQDLLKSLHNRGRSDLRNPKAAARDDIELKDSVDLSDKSNIKVSKLDVAKNLIRNSVSNIKAGQQGPQAGNNNSDSSHNPIAMQHSNNNASANALKMTPQTQMGSGVNFRNLNTIQDIMNNLKTMLNGNDMDPKTKLSLDFQTRALGQMRMSVLHRQDSIDVSIEVGSDSSKQELMKQKDELSEQLKQLGYKNVNVDISYGDHQEQQDTQQKASGNEDARNVKLSGDQEADVSELLAQL